MARIIVAKEKHDCEHLLGKSLNSSHYDILIGEGGDIDEDCDVYIPPVCDLSTQADCTSKCEECHMGMDERRIAFKYRKGFFTLEEQEAGYAGLKDAATISNNRGTAAGSVEDNIDNDLQERRQRFTQRQHDILEYFINPITTLDGFDTLQELKTKEYPPEMRASVWLTNKIPEDFSFDKLVEELESLPKEEAQTKALDVMKNWISGTVYAVPAYSGIAGPGYGRYPRIPFLRHTAYTEHNFEKYKLCYPFAQALNRGFKENMPWRWSNQKAACDKIDPAYVIPDTVFTTITVNNTWKTYGHRDFGDLSDGLSNISVISKNHNYDGAYLVFPEYRVAVNLRPGDTIFANNHEIIHGNTDFIKHSPDAERISVIFYFRDDMFNGGSKEYEDYRKLFLDVRRKDESHPLWRPLWNGTTPSMWGDSKTKDGNYENAREWYEFLLKHDKGREWLDKHHPWLIEYFESTGLEEFF